MIYTRTKDALVAAKARGQKMGDPNALAAANLARAAKNGTPPPPEIITIMHKKKLQGKGLREIARKVNRLSIRTPCEPKFLLVSSGDFNAVSKILVTFDADNKAILYSRHSYDGEVLEVISKVCVYSKVNFLHEQNIFHPYPVGRHQPPLAPA